MILRLVVLASVLMATCFLVFSPTIGYEFVNWDDDIYVYDNPRIRSLSFEETAWWLSNTYYYAYIPVTMLSHSMDYVLWGLNPRGHHLTNVLLHGANTVLMFLLGVVLARTKLARRIGDERGGALSDEWAVLLGMSGAALLFAVHPLRAETVAWVSDRKDLLATFFLIPATVFYLRSVHGAEGKGKGLFMGFSLFFFFCALLAKPVVIGFPIVLLALDWYLLPPMDWNKDRTKLATSKAWFALISVAIAIVLFSIVSGGKRAYAIEQLAGADWIFFPLYVPAFYLFKTFVPSGLSPIYPSVDSGLMMLGAFVTIGITVAVILLARRGQKVYLMCWLVYCIFLFPTIAGFSSGMQAQADRFSYLPMIPLFLLVAGGLTVLLRRGTAFGRLLIPILVLVVVAGFASITIRQSERWESSESLWRYVVESFPPARDYVDAYVNLGAVYAARMDLPDAERVLTKAIEIDSLSADAFYNLGHVLYLRGEWEGAVRCFEDATEVDSGYAPAYYNLAIVSSQLGRDSVAIPAMRRAAALGYREASEALRQAGIHPDGSDGTIPLE